jgi:RNA polymerase sigma-70 factor (ECF subfamily)
MDKDRETALVRDCQRGDRQALDTLVRHFEKPVYNAAYRMLGNVDEAADVTQTAFMKLFENIGRFDSSYRLFSWIYRIALNEAINQLNRRRQLESLEEASFADRDVLQEDLSAAQLSSRVQAVLMDLNEDHRTVIVLRYFTECSYHQIGEILELPVKTVKSRLFTARQQLKSRLQQHGIFRE